FQPLITAFKELCPPDKFNYVLNIGAGAGVETKLLMDQGYTVLGITYGRDNINYAKKNYGIDLKEIDMHDLDFPIGMFDATFSVQSFEHAFSAWWHILEMRRILRDGGRVFFDVPSPGNDELLRTIWHTESLYDNQIDALFWKAGFKKIDNENLDNIYTFCFEKLPDDSFEMWGYVKYIMEALKEV
ncbi:hypothetical protein LCGC14_3048060, partial [marine sediment metagenome]